ncbi:MAG: hypothetical protein KDE00_05940 [Rhodobacteraceae bacterium]|nr:hypothetical protein [Paracoccaceae bacterium]
MQIKRRAITVGTTFFLAAATGHVMQNGETISARLRGGDAAPAAVLVSATPTVAAAPAPAPVVQASVTPGDMGLPKVAMPEEAPVIAPASLPLVTTASGLPDLPAAQPAPLKAGTALAQRVDALDPAAPKTQSAADANYTAFGIACADPVMSMEVAARAMLKVHVAAPCFANERVTVTHEGLMFTVATDVAGDADFVIPAMAQQAFVNLHFASGDEIGMSQPVSGLEGLNRIAVLWSGGEGLHLSALEAGGGFGSAGHVSAAAPRDRGTSLGGFLVTLGDAAVDRPLMAEVYTAPVQAKVDEVIVEAAVTDETCGKVVNGAIVGKRGLAPVTHDTLSFAMPGCDAVGDQLMLSLGGLPQGPVALAASDL